MDVVSGLYTVANSAFFVGAGLLSVHWAETLMMRLSVNFRMTRAKEFMYRLWWPSVSPPYHSSQLRSFKTTFTRISRGCAFIGALLVGLAGVLYALAATVGIWR